MLALVLLMVARAQENSPITVFATSGVVLPSSPMAFANYWKMQAGGGLGVGYALDPSMTLVGGLEYYRFTMDAAGVREAFDAAYMRDIWLFTDVSLNPAASGSSVLTVSANLRVTPSGSPRFVTPYGMAGIGVMRFEMAEIVVPMTNVVTIEGVDIPFTAEQKIVGGTTTSVYVQVGVGAEIDASDLLKPFIEARYVVGMNPGMKTIYIPLTAGVKLCL
jgi:opacity protein-like surface antigen